MFWEQVTIVKSGQSLNLCTTGSSQGVVFTPNSTSFHKNKKTSVRKDLELLNVGGNKYLPMFSDVNTKAYDQ